MGEEASKDYRIEVEKAVKPVIFRLVNPTNKHRKEPGWKTIESQNILDIQRTPKHC